jgi:hypothetical protein
MGAIHLLHWIDSGCDPLIFLEDFWWMWVAQYGIPIPVHHPDEVGPVFFAHKDVSGLVYFFHL